MDPAVSYLISLGYTHSEIHKTKPSDKLEMIAKHFGINHKIPSFSKAKARIMLRRFLLSDSLNKMSFERVIVSMLDEYLKKPHFQPSEHEIVISNLPANKFYISKEWREIRYKVLHHTGNRCKACGRGPKDGAKIHVDHILPRSIYPEYALNFHNLQVLCEDCNLGKSNVFETDWEYRK